MALVGPMAIAPSGAHAAQSLVITDATIIDASAPAPRSTGSILVQDGRILAIGPDVAIPAGARVIDGRGRFVIPGLWDMHAHLAALTEIGRAPERYVGHGVLAVRDMGGHLDSLLALRTAIGTGTRTGPELVMAGPTLNGIQPAPFHRMVETAEEARAAVRELAAAGVDFIKIHRATGREAFEAILDEAARHRLPVAGHVPLVISWPEASAAGIWSIEHIQTLWENVQPDAGRLAGEFLAIADRLDGPLGDSIFAVLRSNGTFFDPTLIGYEESIARASPAVATLRRTAYERMKPIAARAARAGVPIVTGTDVLERHGAALLDELERLVAIGMSPQDVLAAATVTSAAAARRPELGRVSVGAPASFLLLDADPLADIGHLRRLHAVVLRGRFLDAAELAVLRR